MRKVSLNPKDIDAFLKELEQYKKWLEEKTNEFIQRLTSEGAQIASVKFQTAQYDGDNDVTVTVNKKDGVNTAVVATGNAVLFIEFGTGVNYHDNHPESAELGMTRGDYGYKLGRLKSWRYEGNPGTHGKKITKGSHAGEIKTKGNPANMCMYNTVKELENRFGEIAREVFK